MFFCNARAHTHTHNTTTATTITTVLLLLSKNALNCLKSENSTLNKCCSFKLFICQRINPISKKYYTGNF